MTIGLPIFRDPQELRLDRLMTQPFRDDAGQPRRRRRSRAKSPAPDRASEPQNHALAFARGGGMFAAKDAVSVRHGGTAMKPEDVIAGKGRPFTGEEYLESLRDGREVYIYGERVADVTTHPAFRNAARSIARLYDALHDPKHKDVLTCPTDTGSGGFTHKFFRVAHSREDLIGQREAIAALGAHVLRLDGAHAGLQGVADEYARRAVRFLWQVRRQCEGLVHAARRTTSCS